MKLVRQCLLSVCVLTLSACNTIKTSPEVSGPTLNPQLINPQTGQPAANTLYRFTIGRGAIVATNGTGLRVDDRTLEGVTDEGGYIGEIFTDSPLGKNDYVLLEKTGKGKYGRYFLLRNAAGEVLRNTPYRMKICVPAQIYDGVSNNQGYTAFVSTEKVCDAEVSIRTTTQK